MKVQRPTTAPHTALCTASSVNWQRNPRTRARQMVGGRRVLATHVEEELDGPGLDAYDIDGVDGGGEVGPGRCSCHVIDTHVEPSFLEINGIL